MKNIDMKSVIIGALGSLLVFVTIGATGNQQNFGDITVNSIKIIDDGTGGFMSTYNSEGEMTSYLGTDAGGNGVIGVHASHGIETARIGSDENQDGVIELNDRYGNTYWSKIGKKPDSR